MSNIVLTFVFLVIVTTSLSAEVKVRTKITAVPLGTPILKLNGEKSSVNVAALPDDDGFSNWGDLVYKSRQNEDVLLLRDLVIFPAVSTNDQTLKYTASFDNANRITSVRVINVGRERIFATEIDVYSSDVEIICVLPAERDPRVFVEVYGFEN
ncbi:hypothetical protein WA026_000988 [Henosepilachna vigintioctopunctata]|uniref:Uncharacterized protein n=1 Tax=Henosepilachna vigintioctopunctata TaxID=420089 RepID=A0AAW1V5X2_9CUCU